MATTMLRRSSLALLAAAPWAGAAGAGPDALPAAVERAFQPLLARHGVPGMAVGVVAGGRRAVLPFGVASRETGAPVTGDTLFEVGSISKLFAATLLAEAEATGAVALGDRVERWVPELRGAPIGAASLLHLATYTAGGPPLQFPDGVTDDEAALAYFRRWTPQAAPGTQRRYSNPSIALLGIALGRALGRSLPDAMEALLRGLGLRRSVVTVTEAERARYASGYDRDGRPIRLSPGPFAAAAYGVKATAADMLAFAEANLRPEGLVPPLRQAVEATHRAHFRIGPMMQGLGWEQYPWPVPLERLLAGNASGMAAEPHPATPLDPTPATPVLLNKTGSTNGFGAYIAVVPARGIGLVMLANRALPIPARIEAAHAVLAMLADE